MSQYQQHQRYKSDTTSFGESLDLNIANERNHLIYTFQVYTHCTPSVPFHTCKMIINCRLGKSWLPINPRNKSLSALNRSGTSQRGKVRHSWRTAAIRCCCRKQAVKNTESVQGREILVDHGKRDPLGGQWVPSYLQRACSYGCR